MVQLAIGLLILGVLAGCSAAASPQWTFAAPTAAPTEAAATPGDCSGATMPPLEVTAPPDFPQETITPHARQWDVDVPDGWMLVDTTEASLRPLLDVLLRADPDLAEQAIGQRAMLMTQTGYELSLFHVKDIGCGTPYVSNLYVVETTVAYTFDDLVQNYRPDAQETVLDAGTDRVSRFDYPQREAAETRYAVERGDRTLAVTLFPSDAERATLTEVVDAVVQSLGPASR